MQSPIVSGQHDYFATKASWPPKDDLYAEQEKYFDYRDQLHSITAKTLVIVGERDWICPPEQSKTIASKIPGADLRVIANANHGVHLEKNAEVIELIKEHIRWGLVRFAFYPDFQSQQANTFTLFSQ